MTQIKESAIDGLDLPERHRNLLHQVSTNIVDHLGDDVQNISIYGSAARGDWVEGTSDVNMLLILQEASFDQLEQIGDTMAKARRKAGLVPMTLSEEELKDSADVYCVKFDTIQRHHVSVAGKDLVADLDIDESNIRFVCEFQLRNVAMRMRQFYLQSFGQADMEKRFLTNFFTSSLFPLRALARLKDEELSDEIREDFDEIGRALDTDWEVLERINAIHRGDAELEEGELEQLYDGLNRIVRRAVHVVDELE